MDLDGNRESHGISPGRIVGEFGAAYAGYKVGGRLRRRYDRRTRRQMDPGLKAFVLTIAVVGVAAVLVWIGILGYQGFNATR